jgi:serine protease AprX
MTSTVQAVLRGALVTILVSASALPAIAQRPSHTQKLDAALRVRAGQFSGRSRVIVEFNGEPDVRAIMAARGRSGRTLSGLRAQVAELDNLQLASLAADPRVARVMIDRPAFATMEHTGEAVGSNSARETYGVTGRGVGVAIIDSGIAAHDDLGRRVVHFKDFTTDTLRTLWTSPRAEDDYGHGTHVAGIVAANGPNGRTGVAPGANLIGLKVLDGEGRGYVSDVIEAIDYAVAQRRALGIRVINVSVGSGVYESYRTDPLAQAAKRAVDAGIVVVAAAGNLGLDANGRPQFGGITAPGNAPWVLTVGASSHQGTAIRGDDVMARFSSHGPTWIDFAAKPDIIAPGVGIESLAAPGSRLYFTLSDYLISGLYPTRVKPYLSLSGTSMSAPVVSGTVALLLEANPELTPNAVKAILQYTAGTLPNQNALVQGAGLLNARGAIRLARYFANPRGGFPATVDRFDGNRVDWAKHVIWGNYRVRGGVPLPGSNAWARGVTWGAITTRTGTPIVWGAKSGDNIVWSTGADDNIVWSTAAATENIVWSTAGADDNIVWSTGADENIVWSTAADDNIVWSTGADDNIVWSTAVVQNVVWGTDCGGKNCGRVLWGTTRQGTVYGTAAPDDNIVWSTAIDADNIVWSTAADDNIVWSTAADDNIVWSTAAAADNIVWSTSADDNIVWSTAAAIDQVLWSAVAGR